MMEMKKHICDNCGHTFEVNSTVVNPNCPICTVTHIENDGFNPAIKETTFQKEENSVAIPATKELLNDFYTNYDEWGGE